MKNADNEDRKFKVVAFSKIDEFEHHLNTSEEDGWRLHSWNFCDNSYNITYAASMVRDTSRALTEKT